jgi:hypothetical protein
MVAKKKSTQNAEQLKEVPILLLVAYILGALAGAGAYHILSNMQTEYDGVYNVPLDRTTIHHNKFELQVFPHVAFHELAHHIWNKRLNESQKLEFAGYYNHNPQSATEYGSINAEEDFAERYAHSIICRWYEPRTDNEQKDAFIARTHTEYQVVLSHQVWGLR